MQMFNAGEATKKKPIQDKVLTLFANAIKGPLNCPAT